MYNFLFYCFYRTSLHRKGDPVFDGAMYISLLLVGHILTGVMIVGMLTYSLFQYSIRDIVRGYGKIGIVIVSLAVLLMVYRYYRSNAEGVVRKYEERLSTSSHWKWFALSILILCLNTCLMVGSILVALEIEK